MELHSAGHHGGIVAAPHYAAAEAGRDILGEGANALEAMIAMAAAIAVVYPHMNHVGGDGFWLFRHGSGRVRVIDAAGFAGERARRELYRDDEVIPPRGPLAALTVPGAVGGWALAREAYMVTRSQARLTSEKLAEFNDVPGFAATFLSEGKAPAEGAVLRQAALADTIDHLAHAGLDDFYRGDVGREVGED